MSKQSEAKAAQQYCEKPVLPTCANCKHLMQDFFYFKGSVRIEGKNPNTEKGSTYYSENVRCGVGGFAVKKTATCAIMDDGVIARMEFGK